MQNDYYISYKLQINFYFILSFIIFNIYDSWLTSTYDYSILLSLSNVLRIIIIFIFVVLMTFWFINELINIIIVLYLLKEKNFMKIIIINKKILNKL